MRIRISHETRYHYDAPINGVIQTLRLTPRNHDGQYVVHWRIDVSEDCRLDVHEDAFGNITHTFTAEGPFAELAVQVEGEVDVQNTAGIVRGAIERFPPSLYLRATPLTEIDGAIAEFARELRSAGRRHAAAAARPARPAARRDEVRHRPDPRGDHRGGSLRAQARRLPGPHPHLHRGRAPSRHPGALCRRLFPPRRRRHPAGCRPRLGRGHVPSSAGSRSIPPTASARPMPMCASRSASIISAPLRCAAPAAAAARKPGRQGHGRPGRPAGAELRYATGRRRAIPLLHRIAVPAARRRYKSHAAQGYESS